MSRSLPLQSRLSPQDSPTAFTSDEWTDWKWQVRHALRNVEGLSRHLDLTESEIAGAQRAEREGLPISVTPYYLSLASKSDPNCPIRRQFMPCADEAITVEGDLVDPLGEAAHEVVPHLVQRYPDRALLLATDRCGVYCRFCTRSRVVGTGDGAIRGHELEAAIAYLTSHPEVREVIVSGGDPLAMSTERICSVLAAVRAVPTIEVIRLATRAPVTLPMRVTRELVLALRPYHPIWVMTHFNHPKELTSEALAACSEFIDAGFPVNNQTVLLRGINDDAEVLETLFRALIRARVRPYYLLHMDPVRGTSHLRTSLSEGVRLLDKLQGRVSGIALPRLVCDTPHGRGKVPLLENYVVAQAPGVTTLRTFRGEEVRVLDPPGASPSPRKAGES